MFYALHRFVQLESCVIHLGRWCLCVFVSLCVCGGGDIPVFFCLSKQSKAVSGGNAGKCRDDKHSSRIWGEHTRHRTDRVWRRLERNKRKTGSSEGRKKTYRGWEMRWGRWGMQKWPAVLRVRNWGHVSQTKACLQLFYSCFFGCFFFSTIWKTSCLWHENL